MKHCRTCDTTKQDDEFHKRAASPDGLAATCKACQSEYDRARASCPRRRAARDAYAKTDGGIEAARRAKRKWARENKGLVCEVTRRYRERNPNKTKAHGIVGYAIKKGTLVRGPCEQCGATGHVHAHHDDYAKPLSVRWLCPRHHKQWHAEHGEAMNP